MKIIAISLLAVLLVNCHNNGSDTDQPSITSDVQRSMDKHAAEILENPVINAVSIGIYRGGKTYTGHYGELDQGKGNTPTDDTIYEIASVTKTFTGTLAAQAVMDGKISLDDDIRDHLNQDYPKLEFEGKPIRFRHLLTHTSGLPANNRAVQQVANNNKDGLLWKRLYEAERNYSKQAFFDHLGDIRIKVEPGTKFLYSNFATNLTAHILENVYASSYAELLQQYIFDQAGMLDTKLQLNDVEQNRLANGYNGKGELMPHLAIADVLWGAEGGLKSTLPDMLRYIQFQLNQNNPIIAESHRRLHQLDQGYWIGYFWWAIDVDDSLISYRHDGGAIGTRNVLIVYPDIDLGIHVITNNASRSIFPALTKLGEALLEDLKPGNNEHDSKPTVTD